jgi:adenosylcobinamide hydrolase
MRYHFNSRSLFIRGSFRAASTGISGGIRSVSTLINHTVSAGGSIKDLKKELEFVAASAGISHDFFGLITAVPVQQCCVLQYDSVTVFITAGIRQKPPVKAGTINIIICSNDGLEDAALLETIMVATEAKAEALLSMGLPVTGMPADAVIAACEGEIQHSHAGRLTDMGRRVRETVLFGIPEAIKLHDSPGTSSHLSFFIFSRFQGDHWVKWLPDNCPYFPCHHPGQRCDFCYCPFYPCRDEGLGEWTQSSRGGKVWNCARCTLPHEPEVADYLKKFPGASLAELKNLYHKKENQ